MSLFARIAKLAQGEGDRLNCEIIGISGEEIRVRITPDLGPVPSNASDEEVELRTLMATPMTITGTPEEVDALLEEHIAQRKPIQANGADALATKMAEAASKVKTATPKADAGASKSGNTGTPKAAASQEGSDEQAPKETKAPTLADEF